MDVTGEERGQNGTITLCEYFKNVLLKTPEKSGMLASTANVYYQLWPVRECMLVCMSVPQHMLN